MRNVKILALLAVLAWPAAALAEPTAQGFVKERQGELTTLIKKKSDANAKRIEQIFDQMLDYESLAKGSLKGHWDGRTEEERREFQSVLKQLVQRAYRKNLDKTVNYEIRFEGESKADQGVLVKTVARSRSNAREEPVSIDYVLHQVGGTWRIQDIVTEGSSLVSNYHRQFSRIIKKDGFGELLRRMKRKLAGG
jgi:phospholipid transport system substrate-binding protein